MKKSLSLFLTLTLFFSCSLCLVNLSAPAAFAESEKLYSESIVPYGGIIDREVTDTVYYSRKDESETYVNPAKLPEYIAYDMENACAVTAGGAIIGHYDRLYEELIPDHTTFEFLGQWVYGSQDEAVDEMHRELYRRMSTTENGTSVEGYKSGMNSYVRGKGRNIVITGVYGNSKLTKPAYMNALQSGKLLTVFLDGFALISNSSIETHNGYDVICNTLVTGAHVVAAYGYKNIKYYDSNGNLIQQDDYLYVHSGFSTAGLSMIRLTKYITVDDAYIIAIS